MKRKGRASSKVKSAGKKLSMIADARLPTSYGNFAVVAFRDAGGMEHVAITKGVVRGKSAVPVRIHSECLTGDVFHSLRCDCRAQLEAALKKISRLPCGVVLYMRQEGRGIGLANKIRAYALQDKGMDTVQANIALGFPSDMRDYEAAAAIIHELGITSISLITNNPDKTSDLIRHGVKVARRIPHEFGRTKYNAGYLAVKKSKMAHMLTDV